VFFAVQYALITYVGNERMHWNNKDAPLTFSHASFIEMKDVASTLTAA